MAGGVIGPERDGPFVGRDCFMIAAASHHQCAQVVEGRGFSRVARDPVVKGLLFLGRSAVFKKEMAADTRSFKIVGFLEHGTFGCFASLRDTAEPDRRSALDQEALHAQVGLPDQFVRK